MFRKYHYLSADLNNAADQYVAFYNNEPVAFCAVLHMPHPKARNLKRVTRVVTRPDYQGIGIGARLLDVVAQHYIEAGYRFTIVTTTPALVQTFKFSKNWKLKRQGRSGKISKSSSLKEFNKTVSLNRITTAWEYRL